jgi:hypothetical protein
VLPIKAITPAAIKMIARPINEFTNLLRAEVAASVLPVDVMYWIPATIIDITATNPPTLNSMSSTARPIAQILFSWKLPDGAAYIPTREAKRKNHAWAGYIYR